MHYTVTTFKVRLEVCDAGERTGMTEEKELLFGRSSE
jgi:hypothetical protein